MRVVMWSAKVAEPKGSHFVFHSGAPPSPVPRDAWGLSVGRGPTLSVHSMCVLVHCCEVAGTGAVVCWRHLYMQRLSASLGAPPPLRTGQ